MKFMFASFAIVISISAAAGDKACEQAAGLSATSVLNTEESFCPLRYSETNADFRTMQKEIRRLEEQFKDRSPDELEGGLEESLYFGFKDLLVKAKSLGAPYDQLSPSVLFSLFHYSEYGYQTLNKELWKKSVDGPRERAQIRTLTGGLNQLPAVVGTVYRGEVTPRLQDEMDSLERRLAGYTPGTNTQFRGFMSTTLGRNTGKSYMDGYVIELQIKSKTGRNIELLSSRGYEEEVLFRPGTWFKVISRERIQKTPTEDYPLDYQWLIQLEEI